MAELLTEKIKKHYKLLGKQSNPEFGSDYKLEDIMKFFKIKKLLSN
jgi:hypothetical protein